MYGKTLIECNEPITHIDLVDNGATFLMTTVKSSFSSSITKQNWGSIGCVSGYCTCDWADLLSYDDAQLCDLRLYEGAILKRIYLAESYLIIPPWQKKTRGKSEKHGCIALSIALDISISRLAKELSNMFYITIITEMTNRI